MARNFKISKNAVAKRVKKMVDIKSGMLKNAGSLPVRIMAGNSKTGKKCFTVSLIPVADCTNCSECMDTCYDVRNDCIYKQVLESRAQNSAIRQDNVARYWEEISKQIKERKITQLRINVGGDLRYYDYPELVKCAEANPTCDFLFFTKNYKEINEFLDKGEFPKNVQCIFSRWENTPCDNRHNLPMSHVIYLNDDGTVRKTTATDDYFLCPGNCTDCHENKEGCWVLDKGESVGFHAH